MDNIKEIAKELALAIENSEEYKKYCQCKEKISENSDLKNIVDNYKVLETKIELRRAGGEEISKEDEKLLDDAYTKVSSNPICSEFIESEKNVVLMISEIYKILGENISIDMDFFDKL